MPRMQILSPGEQNAFDTPPRMNAAQRKAAFDLPLGFQKEIERLRDPAHQVGFCLNAGYFRHGRRCFAPETFHENDITYVAGRLGHDAGLFEPAAYPDRTRQRHERTIERLAGFQTLGVDGETALSQLIDQKVRAHEKPKIIFQAAVEHLLTNRISLPGYRRLQDLILSAIGRFRTREMALVDAHLPVALGRELDLLLGEGEETDGITRSRLAALKQNSQSVRPRSVKDRLANHTDLSDLFHKLEPVITVLDWDRNSARNCALAVMKSDPHDLRRRKPADRYLHLIAFVVHQYFSLQDNLVATLLNSVKATEAAATREFKDWCYVERKSQAAKLRAQITAFEDHFQSAMATLRGVFEADDLTDADKLQSLHLLLFPIDTEPVLSDAILKDMKDDTATSQSEDARYYDILETKSRRLQNQVSGVMKSLSFQTESHIKPLLAALVNFRKADGQVTRSAPSGFLGPDERKAVGSGAEFRPSLYKVILFQHVARAIKAGVVNLPQSHRYQPLDSYLIGTERWKRDREQLLERAGMTRFSDPNAVLATLKQALGDQFLLTNSNIAEGKNLHVKVTAAGHIKLNTPKQEEIETTALSRLFPQRHYVPLSEILNTVNVASGFTDSLSHLRQQYARPVSTAVLLAGVIGLGCGIGLRKMARISGAIKEDALDHAVNWHFSRENLVAANDRILALMDSLDLPEIYRRHAGETHTASDGQKFEVTGDSLDASHSFKYFGKGQGSSAYVIDGLMHNDVVKSTIHSTDTHGYSEAIFGATYLIDIAYAPRIKGLKHQTLYGFRSMTHENRKNWAVQPDKYVDENIIRTHWDEILRLMVTIRLKETTASDIFRRLNSYFQAEQSLHRPQSFRTHRQNPVHPALHRWRRTANGYIEAMLNKVNWPTGLPERWPSAVRVSSSLPSRRTSRSPKPVIA